jgi:hypothetical protein
MARVSDVKEDSLGFVRCATVKTTTTSLERPIAKLILVLEADE